MKRVKTKEWRTLMKLLVVALVTLFFVQCKKGVTDTKGNSFDPSKDIVITDFYPKEGGVGTNLILYGSNFGNDLSKTKVNIGGKPAKVIGVNDGSLYCVIPEKAYDGDIKVSILDDNGQEVANGKAEESFSYVRKWLVSTFLGKYYEVGSDFEEKEGPFNDCGAFKGILWFSFDPKNHNHLYFTADGNSCRMIDFEKEYVNYFRTGFGRTSIINWRVDGDQDMIASDNHSSDTKYGDYIFSRSSGFTQKEPVPVYARGVNGTIVHPNGELYYSRYRAGDVRRYDFKTGEDKIAFANPYSAVAVYMVMHPSGNYAYLIEYEKHFIMRTDYDPVKKIFKTPYTIAGDAGTAGYKDGVGTQALLNHPVQGVFVKNPNYANAGGDEYDFYFCDKDNHAIRILTPQGRVSTYAGRGNNGTSGYANGDLRTEARFNKPQAIAYDEEKKCFYIGDSGNWIIRKIAQEE